MPTPDRADHSHYGTTSGSTDPTSLSLTELSDESAYQFGGIGPTLQDGLDAEQMMMAAEAIDLDGIDWWFNRADQTGLGVE